jgi:hypothetical protein
MAENSQTVIIVQNNNGEVYIVEDKKSREQVEKILKRAGKKSDLRLFEKTEEAEAVA